MGTLGNLVGGAALAAICLAPVASADTHLVSSSRSEAALLSAAMSSAEAPVEQAIGMMGRLLFAKSASVHN